MIAVTVFAGKKVAVFGLGGSGLTSASALLAGGADVIGWDDDADAALKATSAGIPTADLRQVDWSRISALVLAPGVPVTHPTPHWTVALARAAAVEVMGDIELFCRERRARAPNAPFVAITGTNGKSTTTALVAHLLCSGGRDAQIGGNIGTAILSLAPPEEARAHVVECSSYQIDLAPTLDPSVGVLLNVSEDHLDRHGTLAQNAACAAGAALALGLSAEAIQQGLRSFPGLAHRMEQVGRKARVLFVNDSKATNADSAAQALACFSDIFWIAGGKAKTGGIASLARFFPRMRKAYLIGEAATDFAAELEAHVPHTVAGTLERPVELAAADAEASDVAEPVVLLSPACASFDQYRNFEVRGDKFRELVRALPGLMPSA